jgi:hypothetical protein
VSLWRSTWSTREARLIIRRADNSAGRGVILHPSNVM